MKKIFLLSIIIKVNLTSDDSSSNIFYSQKIPIISLINKKNNDSEESQIEENTDDDFLNEVIIKIHQLKNLLTLGKKKDITSFEILTVLLQENNNELSKNQKYKIKKEYQELIDICNTDILEIDFLIYTMNQTKENPEQVNPKIKILKKIKNIITFAHKGLVL